ncbi:MAG: trypsin-like peptidase domain-containing protein [Nitrospinales bacterium]
MPPAPDKINRRSHRRGRPPNAGTGVIIDGQRGLIVTNSHVVKNVDSLEIKLFGGKKLIGHVLGMDEETDLAVVKVNNGEPLPSAKLGDSSKLKVGQLVVVVGNPYGLSDSMSFGIVSGLNRENVNLSKYEDFIQTDASINPGNSGGPLLNVRGEIVGINTAIINYAQSIGFSIPSNMVKKTVAQLIKAGEVQRGWLGVGIEPVTSGIADEFHVKEGEGVYVNDVFEGDPGFQAGLRVGDIILKVGGSAVDSSKSIIRIIGSISPGQSVNLDIIREGKRQIIPVKLGILKKPAQFASRLLTSPIRGLGLLVHDLRAISAGEDAPQDGKEGVIVTEIIPSSRAEKAGLRKNDLITALNGKKIISREQFKKAISETPRKEKLVLLVVRDNESIHLTLPDEG